MLRAQAAGRLTVSKNLLFEDADTAELVGTISPGLSLEIEACAQADLDVPSAPRLKPRAAPMDMEEMPELMLPASSVPAVLDVPSAPRLKPRAAPMDMEMPELMLLASSFPAGLGGPAASLSKPGAALADTEMPELVLPATSVPAILSVLAAPIFKRKVAPEDTEMPELLSPASTGTGMEDAMKSPRTPLLLPSMRSEYLQSMPALMLPEAARDDPRNSCSLWSEFWLHSISNSDVESNRPSEDDVLFDDVFSNASTDGEGRGEVWPEFEAGCRSAKADL